MKCRLFILGIITMFCYQGVSGQKLSVTDLKVENQVNPLSIETDHPRFSWKLASSLKNTIQTYYEIRVGEDSASLSKGRTASMIWNSGNQKSDTAVLLGYKGPELKAGKRYYWQVRVKDNHGNTSAWALAQFWQTGLKPADWTAKWITVPGPDTSAASPLFRKVFELSKPVKMAMAYLTAKGVYEAQINGKQVSDHYFAPGWTSYNKRLQYQVYEVTTQLKKGANAIGVMLGDGWYKGRISNSGDVYGKTRALLLQLEIEYTDGTKETIRTGTDWKTSYGPVLSSDIYTGEVYDARLEKTGWTKGDYVTDDSWKAVSAPGAIAGEMSTLVSMVGPPVKMQEQFKPLRIFKTPAGETVADFGQNLVGWVLLKARGDSGKRITVSHAEVLDKAGNFYTENLRKAQQQNTFVLNGNEQVFRPHFTYQGFRYVKLDGYPGTPRAEDLTAVALYSDMETTGRFHTSDSLLNQLQHNIVWSQKGNFLDVPTDCPQRDERLGWVADAHVFYNTAAFNMDVAGFFTKWLKDLRADQQADGIIPVVIPTILKNGSAGVAGWADAGVVIPWNMYMAYGDKTILEMQYDSMKSWVNYMAGAAKNDLWNPGFHFGDWMSYKPDDDAEGKSAITDRFLIAQAFYAHSTQLLINAAIVLDKQEDVKLYEVLLAKVKTAFVKEYLTPNGRLVSGTQTAYVLALAFDLLPEEFRGQAAERLVDNIKSYNNHLTTGFLGTPYLCPVLTRFGKTDMAYKLLLQESYPSWLYPVKQGATTIWERWDAIKPDGNFQTHNAEGNSFNHYAYGAVGDWMYKVMGGINTDASAPGYKKIIIAPQPGGRINSVNAELNTNYGLIKSSWKIERGLFRLDVVIPANTTAQIKLPGRIKSKEIGSGTYHFECELATPAP